MTASLRRGSVHPRKITHALADGLPIAGLAASHIGHDGAARTRLRFDRLAHKLVPQPQGGCDCERRLDDKHPSTSPCNK
jgi:hypothetical protein